MIRLTYYTCGSPNLLGLQISLLLRRSSIHYIEGKARLYVPDADGFMELLPGAENDGSPIRRVLQTKWPGLGIDWKDHVAPAI